MSDPRQTEAPYRYENDTERAEAALEELNHYIWRADTPPNKSTLDPNLRRAEEHLKSITEGSDADQGDYQHE